MRESKLGLEEELHQHIRGKDINLLQAFLARQRRQEEK